MRDERAEELSYRAYVTDCAAALVGADSRWLDSVVPERDYDAEAVIEDVISRAGLEVIG